MENLEITMTQPRIANVAGYEKRVYRVIQDSNFLAYIVSEEEEDEWPEEYGYKSVATVTVKLPGVMIGTVEEVEGDIKTIIKRELIEKDLYEEDLAGNLWIK